MAARRQQCQDAMACHEMMRQEFDVVEVTVVKDTQDNTRRGRRRRGGEQFLSFGLDCQFAERPGTPFEFFVLFRSLTSPSMALQTNSLPP